MFLQGIYNGGQKLVERLKGELSLEELWKQEDQTSDRLHKLFEGKSCGEKTVKKKKQIVFQGSALVLEGKYITDKTAACRPCYL